MSEEQVRSMELFEVFKDIVDGISHDRTLPVARGRYMETLVQAKQLLDEDQFAKLEKYVLEKFEEAVR